MKEVFMTGNATRATGEVRGRTRITAVEAETSDDDPRESGPQACGDREPWLAELGAQVKGTVRGRTLMTKAIETSDDSI
jgi:hypothetical protein